VRGGGLLRVALFLLGTLTFGGNEGAKKLLLVLVLDHAVEPHEFVMEGGHVLWRLAVVEPGDAGALEIVQFLVKAKELLKMLHEGARGGASWLGLSRISFPSGSELRDKLLPRELRVILLDEVERAVYSSCDGWLDCGQMA